MEDAFFILGKCNLLHWTDLILKPMGNNGHVPRMLLTSFFKSKIRNFEGKALDLCFFEEEMRVIVVHYLS